MISALARENSLLIEKALLLCYDLYQLAVFTCKENNSFLLNKRTEKVAELKNNAKFMLQFYLRQSLLDFLAHIADLILNP